MRLVSIYGLKDPETNDIFYIGASVDPYTRFNCHLYISESCASSKKDKEIIRLRKNKIKPDLVIIEEVSEVDAKNREQYYIDLYINKLPEKQIASAYPKFGKRRNSMTSCVHITQEAIALIIEEIQRDDLHISVGDFADTIIMNYFNSEKKRCVDFPYDNVMARKEFYEAPKIPIGDLVKWKQAYDNIDMPPTNQRQSKDY